MRFRFDPIFFVKAGLTFYLSAPIIISCTAVALCSSSLLTIQKWGELGGWEEIVAYQFDGLL